MSQITVFDMAGNKVADTELNDAVFGIAPNTHLMHEMVICYLANQRQGTQSTLTRTEVSGGGRKPWRQKGTGQARQGSTRSPQWRHGGVVFAPKPREYGFKMNRKEKALAIKSALTSRVEDGKIFVVDQISLDEIKTKKMTTMLGKLGLEKALIVMDRKDDNVILSARNIPDVTTVTSNAINVFDILKYGNMVITKDAVQQIEEVYA